MPPVIPKDIPPAPKLNSYDPDSLTQVADARKIKDYVNAVLSWSPQGLLAIHSRFHVPNVGTSTRLTNGMGDIQINSNTPQGQANGSETPTAKSSLPSTQKNKLPSTRIEYRSAFYDKHLNPKLLALRIVHCPDLLARIVDIGAVFWELYQKDMKAKTVMGLHSPELRNGHWKTGIKNEEALRSIYARQTAASCIPVACTIYFALSTWFYPPFNWLDSDTTRKYAISNGAFQFVDPSDMPEISAIHETLDEETRNLIPYLRSELFQTAVVWEFKHLTVADGPVMKRILSMGKGESEFTWKFCSSIAEAYGGPNTGGQVGASPRQDRDTVEESRIGNTDYRNHDHILEQMEKWQTPGLDALDPPWRNAVIDRPFPYSPATDELVPPSSGVKRRREHTDQDEGRNEGNNAKRTKQTSEGRILYPSPRQVKVVVDTDSKDVVEKDVNPIQKKDYECRPPFTQKSLMEANSRNRDNAQLIIQQAWAESVRNHCSVLVINSGNYELIGIRHRESQTLYITDLVQPHSPPNGYSYGQIQVGLYICAMMDTIDRATQVKHLREKNQNPDKSDGASADSTAGMGSNPDGTDVGNSDESTDRSSTDQAPDVDADGGLSTLDGGPAGSTKRELCDNCSLTLQEAVSRNLLCLYLRYDMYDSQVPASFLRVGFQLEKALAGTEEASTPSSRESPDSTTKAVLLNEKSFDVILTEQKHAQSTGVVHIGHFSCGVQCNRRSSKCTEIVVKIGFDSDEKRILCKEHKIYTLLHGNGVKGIPKVIGLFEELEQYGDDPFGGPYALILSYVGEDLHGQAHSIPRDAKLSLLSTLDSIHSHDILHGDMAGKNLCMLESGEVFIIDFSHTQTSDDEEAKEDEFLTLCEELEIEYEDAMAAIHPSKLKA